MGPPPTGGRSPVAQHSRPVPRAGRVRQDRVRNPRVSSEIARPARAESWLRLHALFLAALALGVAIRGVVTVAYRPALLFPDTRSYLQHAEDASLSPVRPSGYSLFLRPFVLLTDSLTPIQVVQHAMGLLLAVACYMFLLRRGLPRWGATAAVVPLLLDPLQLVLEHYILSDLLFEVMLVLACLALL